MNEMASSGRWTNGSEASLAEHSDHQSLTRAREVSLEELSHLAARRIAIEGVEPEIDAGRFAAACVVDAPFVIEADVFCDGHDSLHAALLWRPADGRHWHQERMEPIKNDRWRCELRFKENRLYEYTIIAWRDPYSTWRKDTSKKYAAGQKISLEIEEALRLIQGAIDRTDGVSKDDRAALVDLMTACRSSKSDDDDRYAMLNSEHASQLMDRAGPRTNLTHYDRVLRVFADRRKAAFSAWYELMPRSQSGDPGRHGTFNDVIERLPYVKDLGFDVLYFPPIHPIGETNRKGRNNSLKAGESDPGSPYAIGSEDGGHDAIHPELGTFEDFSRLVSAAHAHGLEVALDFAIQCSPDHPWIKERPHWFDWRPDGTIKFAENPPKKYEDIVNVHFYRDAIPGLWYALRDVVLFWAGHGIRIFRVDNPHTKPLPFWEWMIAEVRARYPEVIFLAEAFTRPKMMKRLAKTGFAQSYSYFTWRNEKAEIEEYLTELTTTECRHYMRPNFFTNTPDINPRFLQDGGRAGFQIRLALAASLGGNYGIYNGYEICEAAAVPGKEEYLNSEKYEIRAWDFEDGENISWDIKLMNRLRHEHEALQEFTNLEFYNVWNDNIIYYGKRNADLSSFLLFHVCLDPHNAHGADFEVPLWEFGLADDASIEVEDLVSDKRFTWHGKYQQIHLDPRYKPFAIWRLYGPGVPR